MLKNAIGFSWGPESTEMCSSTSETVCSQTDITETSCGSAGSCSLPCGPTKSDNSKDEGGCCDMCCAPSCCVFVVPNFDFHLWSYPGLQDGKSNFGAMQFTPQQFHLSIWKPPAGQLGISTV